MATDPEDWVDRVAGRAGLSLPLQEATRRTVVDAIADAVDAVAAHVGRPALPAAFTESGVWPDGAGGWQLTHDRVIAVQKVTPEVDGDGYPTGAYTVEYTAGLDPDGDAAYGAALRRYVIAHAAASPDVARLSPGGRQIRSVSVEGQSVTYDTPQAGSGAPGAAPDLTVFDRWRRRGVYQERGIAPHPLEGLARWR